MNIEKFRIQLKEAKIFNYSLDKFLSYLALIIIVISITNQIYKLFKTGSAKNYSLYFILLQLIGSPEGGGAAITGYMINNKQLTIMGTYGFLYYCIALYFYLNPKQISKNKNKK